MPSLKDGQPWAAGPPTQVSALPLGTAASCSSLQDNTGDKTMFSSKSTQKFPSATGIMNHLLASPATEGTLKKKIASIARLCNI